MTNRRDFLKLNLTAATAALFHSATVLGAVHSGNAGNLPIYALLLDYQIPGAALIKERLHSRVESYFSVEEGLDNIWTQALWPMLNSTKSFVAGVTSGHQAFTLQEAARDLGHALVQSVYLDEINSSRINSEGLSISGNEARLDSHALNTDSPVLWVMGPSGIDFRSKTRQ